MKYEDDSIFNSPSSSEDYFLLAVTSPLRFDQIYPTLLLPSHRDVNTPPVVLQEISVSYYGFLTSSSS